MGSIIFVKIFTLLLLSQSYAGPPVVVSLQDRVRQVLPTQLHKIQPGKSTRQEVEAALGKPDQKSDRKNYFYSIESGSPSLSDTTVSFEGDRVRYVRYELSSKSETRAFSFQQVESELAPDSVKKAKKRLEVELRTQHQGGRFFVVQDPKMGLEFKFKNDAQSPIQAVIFWQPGRAAP